MKTAVEVAQDLTNRPAVAVAAELSYEDAYHIALETGTTVEAVQAEHRRKQAPLAPLAKAMLAHSATLAQCDKAVAVVEEALSIQAQFEALVQRRASIRAILARGQELLNQSLAAVEWGKAEGWPNWHIIERDSPAGILAVYQFVSAHLMHEKIVAWFPDWQEHQSGQLHRAAEKLAWFEKHHGLKAQ